LALLGKASIVSKKNTSTLGSYDEEDSNFSKNDEELKHDDDLARW